MKRLEEVHVYYKDLLVVERIELVTPDLGTFDLPASRVRKVVRTIGGGPSLPMVEVTFRGRLVEHGPVEVPDGA